MHRSTRRRFLCMMGSAGSAVACSSFLPPSIGSAFSAEPTHQSSADSETVMTRSGRAFGSKVTLRVLHTDRDVARIALSAAFDELELIESLLSLYRPQSQLSRLNRTWRLDDPHPLLVEVLQAAQAMSRRSNGAFDVTVQPLWGIFSRSSRRGRLPSGKEISRARESIGWERVEVDRQFVRLADNKMALTLNGIAQGFAADHLKTTFANHGVSHALIDAGEFASSGTKTAGAPWRVGIQHPRHENAFVSVVDLAGRCLATSGDYATAFSSDLRDHHLFDPRTGRSPTELASVSIAATSAIQADALSTAVFVLGPDAGLELVKTEPDCDALLVRKNGSTLMTDGFPAVS